MGPRTGMHNVIYLPSARPSLNTRFSCPFHYDIFLIRWDFTLRLNVCNIVFNIFLHLEYSSMHLIREPQFILIMESP